jgi:phosphatidylglycerol---prolipoprotein diacylglyceryl transferase
MKKPDFGQPVYWVWMSKGQLLTIPVIVIGIVLAIPQFQRGAVPKR